MKIAFIGTHGTGKTTLCHFLTAEMRKRGMHAEMVTEVARHSPLPINKKTNRESQLWILTTQVAKEIEAASKNDYLVTDRSVLDNYAYQVVNGGRDPMMEALVDHWMPTYDTLFRVPNLYTLVDDGVRDQSLTFQKDVEKVVDQLLIEKSLPFVDLPKSGQLEFIIDYLKLPDVKGSGR